MAAPPKDHWQSDSYSNKVAPFVPLLTTKIVSWLDPQPEDVILDLGAGDGILTAAIAPRVKSITSTDGSANLLEASRQKFPDIETIHLDGRELDVTDKIPSAAYNKVFSNAALHWILGDPTKRANVIRGCYRVLQPGGKLVAEMGGMGNIAEVHGAIISALVHRGIPHETITKTCPWFFPSVEAIKTLLEAEGFQWNQGELELRQTELTSHEEGGVAGWVRLFGDPYLQLLKSDKERDEAVQEVAQVLEHVGRRQDGVFILNYIRLRFVATKPQ